MHGATPKPTYWDALGSVLNPGRGDTIVLGVELEGNVVRIRLSRKPKKLWLAYPARNPSPLAVRVNCPEIAPAPCIGTAEGLRNSPTATPATKPVGMPICIRTKSRGASSFAPMRLRIARNAPMRVPRSENIIGRI